MKRRLTFQWVLTSTVLATVVLGGFLLGTLNIQDLRAADLSEQHSARVLATANALEKSLLDLETGLRGYLLAGKPLFLAPYRSALATYPALAAQLRRLSASEPAQQARAAQIDSAIGAYATTWAVPLIAEGAQNLHAARNVEAEGGGKKRVDAIRRQFQTFTSAQGRIDLARTRHVDDLGARALILGTAGILVSAALLLLISIRVHRGIVLPLRRLATSTIRLAAGELSIRVPAGGTGEVRELTEAFNAMAQSLELQRDELENQKAELEAHQLELEHVLSAVEEQKAHVELLQRFGDRMAGASVGALAGVVMREIADVGRADVGALYLFDEKEETFLLAAHRGLSSVQDDQALSPGEGVAGRALFERRTVAVSYGRSFLRVSGLLQGGEAAHELHLPLLHGERTIGLVSLGRTREEPFSSVDVTVLEALAQRAAVACAEALSVRQIERLAHQHETLLASTDEGIYGVDRNGFVTLVNPATVELTGFSAEELLGHNAHELLHHTRADGTGYPQAECPVFQTTRTGEPWRSADDVYWRRDGTSFPVEYSCSPLFDQGEITGAVVTFRDISTRWLAERGREIQHAVTRVLAEASSLEEMRPRVLATVCEGMNWEIGFTWVIEEDGSRLRCTASYAAPGFEELAAGLCREDQKWGEGPAGLALSRVEPVIYGDLELQSPRLGVLRDRRLRSGIALPVVGSTGAVLGVIEFFSRQSVASEGTVDTLGSICQPLAQYAERRYQEVKIQQMRDEFVATVSHELRTPLTSIDGWLHILLGGEPGPLTDDQRRFLTTVKRNSERLMRLVGDLLAAGQIESGELSLELGDLDFVEIAREAIELVNGSAAEKQITIALDAPSSVLVMGDRARLMQLLTNLLSNAVKFTPEQGNVQVEISTEESRCRIEVSDSGIGIPPDEREHLFERFYRTSTATANGISGTGLGLAISKAIAESHAGRIYLPEHDGPGSVFVVELPLPVREEVYS